MISETLGKSKNNAQEQAYSLKATNEPTPHVVSHRVSLLTYSHNIIRKPSAAM